MSALPPKADNRADVSLCPLSADLRPDDRSMFN
jgi:hypothetical protein